MYSEKYTKFEKKVMVLVDITLYIPSKRMGSLLQIVVILRICELYWNAFSIFNKHNVFIIKFEAGVYKSDTCQAQDYLNSV